MRRKWWQLANGTPLLGNNLSYELSFLSLPARKGGWEELSSRLQSGLQSEKQAVFSRYSRLAQKREADVARPGRIP